jgi:hypothetical protein
MSAAAAQERRKFAMFSPSQYFQPCKQAAVVRLTADACSRQIRRIIKYPDIAAGDEG